MRHWGLSAVAVALTGCTVQVVNPVVNAPVSAAVQANVAAPAAEPQAVTIEIADTATPGAPAASPAKPSSEPSTASGAPHPAAATAPPEVEPSAAPSPVAPVFEKVILDNGFFQFKYHAALRYQGGTPGQIHRSTTQRFPRASLYVSWSLADASLEQVAAQRKAAYSQANRDILSDGAATLDGLPAYRLAADGGAEVYAIREGWLYKVSYSYPIDAADTAEHLAGVDLLIGTWKWGVTPVASTQAATPTPTSTLTPHPATPTPVFVEPSPDR